MSIAGYYACRTKITGGLTTRSQYKSEPPIIQAGYCFFLYENIPGPLHYLNFAEQMHFPETQFANGFQVVPYPGITCEVHEYVTANPAVVKISDQVISILASRVAGSAFGGSVASVQQIQAGNVSGLITGP